MRQGSPLLPIVGLGAAVLGACTSVVPPIADDTAESDTPGPTDTPPVETETDTGLGPVRTPDETLVLSFEPTVWLRADDLPAVNGESVARWTGVGRTQPALQSELYLQPQVRVGLASTLPAVRFDGVDDRLDLGDISLGGGDGFTVVAVVRTTDPDGHLVGIASGSAPPAPQIEQAIAVVGGGARLSASDGRTGLDVRTGDGTLADGAWHVVTAIVRPPVSSVLLDGVVAGSSFEIPARFGEGVATLGARDGLGRGDTGSPLAFDLREVVVVPRALSTCDRWAVERVVAERSGLNVGREVLPVEHAYASADLPGEVGSPVITWPARPAVGRIIGPLRATSGGPAPTVVHHDGTPWARFDGVDDQLHIPGDVFAEGTLPTTVFVVVRGLASDGFLLGSGASVPDVLGQYGGGLGMVDGAVGLFAGDGVRATRIGAATRVDDGGVHVVVATMTATTLSLNVDGVSSATPRRDETVFALSDTIGSSDGSATGASQDALGMDLAEFRSYRYEMDGCGVEALRQQLAARYGAPP